MVGGIQQQQQELQLEPPTTATPKATSAEEEALKRNTDCVYFLASPLTCKKGAECEYRHSDVARVNPRDCWYWLNGNCLNPKCAFRHPPLDGLLGVQVPTPAGSAVPPSQTAVTSVPSVTHNSGKQATPCIFFQRGFCLKGDRCPFLHAPNTVNNKVPQGPPAATVSDPPAFKKVFGGLEKCSQEQKVAQANLPKSAELLSQAKPQAKVETALLRNEVAVDRHVWSHSGMEDQPPRYRPTNTPPASNGNSIGRSSRVQQVHVSDDHDLLNVQQVQVPDDHGIQSSKDADEFSREPSPGFDVLVDDELRDSDYYPNEGHYGRTRGHEGKTLNPMDGYDIGHSADFDSMVDVDRDIYCDSREYDSYERMQGQCAREQRRASSERVLGGSARLERKRYPRADSPDQIGGSDLRHHLSKQRRGNGLRSVISHDRTRENHAEDQSYRTLSRRMDTHNLPSNEGSVSNRLRGRIKLPVRSPPPVNGGDLHPEREMERGRNWGRLSPGKSQNSTHLGRLRDRIKGRVLENINNEERSFRGQRTRDVMNDNSFDFAGPKRLAELKGGQNADSNKQQLNDQQSLSLGKRKFQKLDGHSQSETDLSFEGPKPLSEILKRKRAAPGRMSGCKEDTNNKDQKESSASGLKSTVRVASRVAKGQANHHVQIIKEDCKSANAVIAEGSNGGSVPNNESELETEEGMIVDDAMEDPEPETFDHKEDGESDYEQVEGDDYTLDEGDNAEAEEYLDDEDDGDDFAKKIGVMFS